MALHSVLHIVASGGLYGIERMLLSLLPALRGRGAPVVLACLNRRGGAGSEIGEAMAQLGVPVRFLDPGRSKGLRSIPALIRQAGVHGARAMHTHGYKTPVLAALATGLARIPVVGTFHSEALRAPHLRRYVRIESWFLRHFRALVAVSDGVRDDLERRGVPPSRIRVIPNGIPDPAPNGILEDLDPDRRTTIAYIGRLSPEKNVDLLIEAVARLRQRGIGARLLAAGDGPERERLAAQAADSRLAGAVHLLGFQADTTAVLRRAGAFALPSSTEGVPMALLEAMAVGVPVVASAVGGIPAVAAADREAILVPPGDLDALVGALERLLTDPSRAAAQRSAARRRYLADFTVDRMADRYMEFYREIGL